MVKYKQMHSIFWPIILSITVTSLFAKTPSWYESYQAGLVAMKENAWKTAMKHFEKAIHEKDLDSKKQRAFGTIFIEYFPHRELGICYYYLNDLENAKRELNLSLQHSSSKRAKEYLQKINEPEIADLEEKDSSTNAQVFTENKGIKSESSDNLGSEIVGDRLSIAVLPFESKGLGDELGSIDLLDKLITGFVNINRFKVIERALLEKILQEQKLAMSGIIDASTAAEIGKGIGVDAVVVGSVTRAHNALSIDARLIDTETAAIITAKDAYSSRISLQDISQMISDLADKIRTDLPIVNGYVIGVTGERITLDIGRADGMKKGMKCHIYREGAPIVHPMTGKVIAKEIDELCEAQLTDVFDAYSIADIIQSKRGIPRVRDKIVTK